MLLGEHLGHVFEGACLTLQHLHLVSVSKGLLNRGNICPNRICFAGVEDVGK